jgi:hypothetical protein
MNRAGTEQKGNDEDRDDDHRSGDGSAGDQHAGQERKDDERHQEEERIAPIRFQKNVEGKPHERRTADQRGGDDENVQPVGRRRRIDRAGTTPPGNKRNRAANEAEGYETEMLAQIGEDMGAVRHAVDQAFRQCNEEKSL